MSAEKLGLLRPPRGQEFYDAAQQNWTALTDSYSKKGGDHFPFNEGEVKLYFTYKENIQKAIVAGHPMAAKDAQHASTYLARRAARLDSPRAVTQGIRDRQTHIDFFKQEANELSGMNSCCSCTLT